MKAACFELSSGHAKPASNESIGLDRGLKAADSRTQHFLIATRDTVLLAAALVLTLVCSSASAQLQPRAPQSDNGPSRPPPWVDPAPRPLPGAPSVLRSRAVAQTIYQYSPFFLRLGTAVQQGFDRTPVPEWSWGDGSPDSFGRTAKIWQQPGTFYGRVTGFRGGVRFQQTFRTEVVDAPIFVDITSTCAIRADRRVMCWGHNKHGQIGDGTQIQRETPQLVVGLANVMALAVGELGTCALKTDRTVACWGRGDVGGNGPTSDQLIPKAVAGLADIRSIAGSTYHFCAIKGDATVACWGTKSRFGVTPPNATPVPTLVAGVTGAVALALGASRSCALKTDGTGVCWGSDLINGPTDSTPPAEFEAARAPKLVTGLSGAVAIALGQYHDCFLKVDGTVHCRGGNYFGALGEPPEVRERDSLAAVPGVSGIVALSGSGGFVCGLKADGTVLCWGDNRGGWLKKDVATDNLPPTDMFGRSGTTALSAGSGYACVLKANGSLACWGNNAYGRLGTGGNRYLTEYPPVPVAGGAVFWK